MPCSREELENRERQTLASYAQMSGETRGRVHPDSPAPMRTQYQRDRDRVIHSRAFRRLEYKTQVFLNGTGDHLRTRLTHTMEVAAISRGIARALRLNEDLAETIALAHDLGHSPFGHRGETVLNKLMRGHGGFEHNKQSLRIVEELENKYPGYRGLNLTWEVREGLMKHQDLSKLTGTGFKVKSPSLEAQLADLGDELTYCSQDLDDGLDCGLLSEKKLKSDVKLFAEASKTVKKNYGVLPDETRLYCIIRAIIDRQVRDVVETTEEAILASGVSTADEVRQLARPLVQYSPERRAMKTELRKYLYANLYSNPEVHGPNTRAVQMLEDLFKYYVKNRKEIGAASQMRARKTGWHRAICDYIAGMTDRYAMQEHLRLFPTVKE